MIISLSSTNQNRNYSRPIVVPIPDEVKEITDDIKRINGLECLQGSVNLWNTVFQMPLPLPSLHRIIPAIYAYWNAVKSGSDTTTKLMDGCILRFPKSYQNPITVAVNHIFELMIVLVHRLQQTFFIPDDLDLIRDLQTMRKNNSAKQTFHECLLRIYYRSHTSLGLMKKQSDDTNNENEGVREHQSTRPSRQ